MPMGSRFTIAHAIKRTCLQLGQKAICENASGRDEQVETASAAYPVTVEKEDRDNYAANRAFHQ
jgi:hypothetical protein